MIFRLLNILPTLFISRSVKRSVTARRRGKNELLLCQMEDMYCEE